MTPDESPFAALVETLVETPAAAAPVMPADIAPVPLPVASADAPQRTDNIGVIRDLLRKLEEAAAETSQSAVQLKPTDTAIAVAAVTLPQVAREPGLSALRRTSGGDAVSVRPLDLDAGPISLPSPGSRVAIAAPRKKRGKGAAFAIGFTSFALGVAAAAAVIVTLDPIKSWKSAVTTAQVTPSGPPSRATGADKAGAGEPRSDARAERATQSAPAEARASDAKPDGKIDTAAAGTTSTGGTIATAESPPSASTSGSSPEAAERMPSSKSSARAPATAAPVQGAAVQGAAVQAAPVQASAPAPVTAPPVAQLRPEMVARAVPFSVASADRIEIRPGESRSIALRIDPAPVHTDPLLIVLRGVPSWLTISKGSTIGDEIWLLPAHQAGDLAVSVVEGAEGAAEIKVQIAHLDGRILAESRTLVRALRPVRPSPLVAAVPEAGEQSLLRMLARGELLLDTGEVESARLLLRTAAEGGSVAAALKLAQTYDPGEMRKLGMADASADPALAVRWYERAQSLGSPVAAARLAELSPR